MNNDTSWLLTLHALHRTLHAASPAGFFPPAQASVQLRGTHSLATDAGWHVQVHTDARPVLVNPWFSLAGALGALPLAFTEQLGRDRTQRTTAPQDFLDIFNHRAQSLLYRTLCQCHVTLSGSDGSHLGHAALLAALCGIPPGGERRATTPPQAHVPLGALTAHAALFARRVRSAAALVQLLRAQFALEIRLQEFTGTRHELPAPMLTRLGTCHGRNNDLGRDALLGTRAMLVDGGITIVVVLHTQQDFARVQRDELIAQLQNLARTYVGHSLDIDIDVELPRRLLPAAQLGSHARHDGVRGFGFGVLGKVQDARRVRLRIHRQGQEPRRLRPSVK